MVQILERDIYNVEKDEDELKRDESITLQMREYNHKSILQFPEFTINLRE